MRQLALLGALAAFSSAAQTPLARPPAAVLQDLALAGRQAGKAASATLHLRSGVRLTGAVADVRGDGADRTVLLLDDARAWTFVPLSSIEAVTVSDASSLPAPAPGVADVVGEAELRAKEAGVPFDLLGARLASTDAGARALSAATLQAARGLKAFLQTPKGQAAKKKLVRVYFVEGASAAAKVDKGLESTLTIEVAPTAAKVAPTAEEVQRALEKAL